ncbi:PrgU protein [Enterococcus faecalis EnGen0240]|uniref:pheromone response system RNA-binding regulator PrgU n=1 Tax=Enterococcus faecalis TaxID=1351 RepID=UPI0001B1DDED|nr:pheromone response system RNA-binding regulator PrgU [Enterococcus faecalis]EET96802.1 PrgU protein [Enterococcus faecalis T1]EGO9399050.1 type III secretion system protein PrgU [Enterococcus faecalis]EOL56742.1 PrgU protein [Enterococcus faecalis EnGen0240]MDN3077293.1 pheromone response system RNA-binding regulator PrgU [Enterococcus faecalis]HBA1484359.1 pheromone response system RNA-binding regulator PrgU [Enterococcus faecalis]
MEAVVAEREAKGMKEIAIQEKDLTLQWRGNTGKLVKVRLKNTRAMEMWYNKQITEENIQEITTLNIIKNGKSLALEVYPEKSIYVKPNLGRINVPVFFIKTPINRGTFEGIFGETLKA